jgi:hypothetical protein
MTSLFAELTMKPFKLAETILFRPLSGDAGGQGRL